MGAPQQQERTSEWEERRNKGSRCRAWNPRPQPRNWCTHRVWRIDRKNKKEQNERNGAGLQAICPEPFGPSPVGLKRSLKTYGRGLKFSIGRVVNALRSFQTIRRRKGSFNGSIDFEAKAIILNLFEPVWVKRVPTILTRSSPLQRTCSARLLQ